MFHSLLIPRDGSEFAKPALPLAVSIAQQADAALYLTHMVPTPPLGYVETWHARENVYAPGVVEAAGAYQETTAERMRSGATVAVETTVLGGEVAAEIVIPSDTTEVRRIQDEIERFLRCSRCTERDLFGIKLALAEALVNAIKHGNQLDRARSVQIAYRILPDRFEINITDQGSGFDPCDVPDPTAVENLERPCGRGSCSCAPT
jgi:serine/threonine-protein kinase RsbW